MFRWSSSHLATLGPLEPLCPPPSTAVPPFYSDPGSAVLVHTSLVPAISGAHFPRPSEPWSTLPLPWLYHILAMPLLSYLARPSSIFSTPEPLPPSALSHPGLSPWSPSLYVFDFNHLLFLASPPPVYPDPFTSPPCVPQTLLYAFRVTLVLVHDLLSILFTWVCLSICLATILIVPVLPCPLLVLP